METGNNTLINELLDLTDASTASAMKFRTLPLSTLNFKEDPDKWSMLECVEHLNRYGDYYLAEIDKAISRQKAHTGELKFRSGTVGNWFANLMKVKNGRMVKMKTLLDKNPAGSVLNIGTLDRFIGQQEKLKSLLERARTVDLTKTKVPISLAKFMKLRLGDTLRFFTYHIERHIFQAQRVLDKQSGKSVSGDVVTGGEW